MHNLSVIIPFYNERKFLLDSVNRVLETDIAKLEARTYELHNRCRKANEEKLMLQKKIKQLKGELETKNAQ